MIDEQDMPHATAIRRPVALEPGQPCYRILIVDDNFDNRRYLDSLLQPFGFELREANNGQEAIDIWNSWEPHLIWMDFHMPVLDGHDAIRHIRRSPNGSQTVVILMSASMADEDRVTEIAAEYNDFVRKPFREHEVFDLLRTHLGVQFVYEGESPGTFHGQHVTDKKVLTIEELSREFATLPHTWRTNWQDAVESLNIQTVHDLIFQIRTQNPALAEALDTLAKEFRFDVLQELS